MPFRCIGGSLKCHFLVYGNLGITILLYRGGFKIPFCCIGGLENAIFCIGGLENAILL